MMKVTTARTSIAPIRFMPTLKQTVKILYSAVFGQRGAGARPRRESQPDQPNSSTEREPLDLSQLLSESSDNVVVGVYLKDGGIAKMPLADSVGYIESNPERIETRRRVLRRSIVEE